MTQEDSQANTKKRVFWTKKQVSKTIKYFLKMDKLKFINGHQTIPKVAKDIQQAIDSYSKTTLTRPLATLSRQGRGKR